MAKNKDGARRSWSDRVSIARGPKHFAHVPDEVLTSGGGPALALAQRLFPNVDIGVEELDGPVGYTRLSGIPSPLLLIAELKRGGFVAYPNHVFFAHPTGASTGPHPALSWGALAAASPAPYGPSADAVDANPAYASPAYASPAYASPAYASPAYASPAYASPAYASPAYASPAYASPAYASPAYASPAYASPAYASPAYASPAYASPAYASPAYASPAYASPAYASGVQQSSALPASRPYIEVARDRLAVAAASTPGASVVVLDTGLAHGKFRSAAIENLESLLTSDHADEDTPDPLDNDQLGAASGHGTFIAGIVEQVAPGARVSVHRVLTGEGDGDEVTIAKGIRALPTPPTEGAILNLSFGGYVMDDPGVMASAVADAQARGYVVVASAGNEASSEEPFPASFPDVIAVGAIGPFGPAPFTNYGPWVRACAPGVNLVSTFFRHYNGDRPAVDGVDADDFHGWACWSGTSFAAPVVSGALAREMATTGCTAKEAVWRLIDQPSLLRLPGLGTVINVL